MKRVRVCLRRGLVAVGSARYDGGKGVACLFTLFIIFTKLLENTGRVPWMLFPVFVFISSRLHLSVRSILTANNQKPKTPTNNYLIN